MATGFAPYILRDLKTLAGEQYPGLKVDAAGFTGMLLENSSVSQTQLVGGDGHLSEIRFKYKARLTDNYVGTERDCDLDYTPAYLEATLSAPRTASVGLYFSRATMAQYMAEATNRTTVGSPSVGVFAEVADSIAHAANAMIAKIDKQLLADVTWGDNVTSGASTAETINLDNDTTVMSLSAGIPKLLGDLANSGFSMSNAPLLVGGGIFQNYDLARKAGVLGVGTGIDYSKQFGYKYYADVYANATIGSVWAANQIGAFDKGSIHLVQSTTYQGFMAGRHAQSEFFTITLPVNTGYGMTTMTFDAQLREYDCPTTITNGYTGGSETVQPGYQLILSKVYGLFQQPTNAILSNDRLYETNGAIRFAITNT